MVEVKKEQERKVRCLLVGAPALDKNKEALPKELQGLVTTLGMEIADTIVLARIEPNPVYGIGKGKAGEIADEAKEAKADCIIFDWEIEPTKQRNWEKLAKMPVFDRNEVILRIFASRAKTREASLQVELARLTYSMPRLSHSYGDMARQRGGSFGAKGSGETQLELDRRQIEDKILDIKKEIKQVSVNRETQRKRRERTASFSCSLVGYTNAGKSSLLNALTGADVFVKDELFATLDPTTRRLELPEGSSILLTDTVGFISNLPHLLIDSFKSTLEEAAHANLLLIVVDASDSECVDHYKEVLKVLEEIHADKIQRIVLLNKIDRIKDNDVLLASLDSQFPGSLHISATTHEGFDTLLAFVIETLLGKMVMLKLPLDRSDLAALVRKNGTVSKEEWLDDCISITARIPGTINEEGSASSRTLALLSPYLVK